MKIIICEENNKKEWDKYVLNHPTGSCYHLFIWRKIIEGNFHHKPFYLMVLSDDKIVGVLPLIYIKSFIFGNSLVSMPYFNYGGICADNKEAQDALLKEARILAVQLNTPKIEIRGQSKLNFDSVVVAKDNKVNLLLHLPKDPEELWKSMKSKMRSQIRRPEKEGEVVFLSGGVELFKDFYYVFSLNMRRLGTPVHLKAFFVSILEHFPRKAKIHILYLKGKAVSVGFTIGYKNSIEIPWASSEKKYNKFGINMCFYWNILKQACLNEYKIFDFGRSTINEGTFHFKKQWGAKPVPLYWHYLSSNDNELSKIDHQTNSKYQLATAIWTKLPLKATQMIGPGIRKDISA